MTTRAALGRVRRGMRGHDEERRGRLLDLLVGVVYAADQRVNQFICRAMRQPLDEELIN